MKVLPRGQEARQQLEENLHKVPSNDLAIKIESPKNNGIVAVTTGNLIKNKKGETEIVSAAHGAVDKDTYLSGNSWMEENTTVTFQQKSTGREIGKVENAVIAGAKGVDIGVIETGLKLPQTNTKLPEANSIIPTDEELHVSSGFGGGTLNKDRETEIIENTNILPAENLASAKSSSSSQNPSKENMVALANNKGDKKFLEGDSGAIVTDEENTAHAIMVQKQIGGEETVLGLDLGSQEVQNSIKKASEEAEKAANKITPFYRTINTYA